MTIDDAKKHLNRQITWRGSQYKLTGLLLRRNDTGLYYQAELRDLQANNSSVIARLEEVEESDC